VTCDACLSASLVGKPAGVSEQRKKLAQWTLGEAVAVTSCGYLRSRRRSPAGAAGSGWGLLPSSRRSACAGGRRGQLSRVKARMPVTP
jgi:hypothetical protein